MENIREARESDLERLKILSDENFGVDFYTTEYLLDAIRSEDRKFYVYTDENDEPVAYQFMFVISYARARKLLKITGSVPGLENLDDSSTVGIYKTSCTDKKYRGRGIFKSLVTLVEEHLSAQGIKVLMGDAMRHPSGFVPVAASVEKIGFRAVSVIPHPWSDIDSYCPYCNNRFCQCDAVLYIKELE